MIAERLEKTMSARPRATLEQKFVIGQHVDFFRRSERKQLEGWRGPAIVLQLLTEGYIALRWQSQVHDVPVNLVRPHANRKAITAITARFPEPEPAAPSSTEPVEDDRAAEAARAEAMFCQLWEEYWLMEATDAPLDEPFNALVSVASNLPPTTQHIHGISNKNGVIKLSEAAVRDSAVLFNLGKATAASRAIPNYLGVILASGRRFIASQPSVLRHHV